MKLGFWSAPERAEEALVIAPLAPGDEAAAVRSKLSFLATVAGAEAIARCPRAAALLPQLAEALAVQKASRPARLFDITDYDGDDLELIGQVLGQGEVSGVAALPDGVMAEIQEATVAGLWRVRFFDAARRLAADYLEVAAIPEIVRRAAGLGAERLAFRAPPTGAMNVMPLLTEIDERMRAPSGDTAYVINFSLLPMNEVDMAFLQQVLGEGSVQLLSRGYGACKVTATGARNVWSVQFFNASDAIILDTLEIGGVPAAACAAEEDFSDSAERLREIHEAYFT
ncbi:MAG TPA: hydrogenase expression/formation C-terminal domain-containing protein [Methylocystis sp.]|nr:hydrogenase expression/formation C-terminal domain-containing protein [Methylocystis sp.]